MKLLLGIILTVLASCMSDSPISREKFPSDATKGFLRCIVDFPNEIALNCKASRVTINERGEGNLTPLMWFLQSAVVSPAGIRGLVKMGADPFVIDDKTGETAISYTLANLSIDHLRAFLDAGLNINEEKGPELVQSVRSSAIAYWNDEKMLFLIERGLDLERRNGNGETAILEAGAVPFDGGPFKKQLFLIDHGADPRTVNSRGQNICWWIEHDVDISTPGDPNYRLLLAERLRQEFGVVCKPELR